MFLLQPDLDRERRHTLPRVMRDVAVEIIDSHDLVASKLYIFFRQPSKFAA